MTPTRCLFFFFVLFWGVFFLSSSKSLPSKHKMQVSRNKKTNCFTDTEEAKSIQKLTANQCRGSWTCNVFSPFGQTQNQSAAEFQFYCLCLLLPCLQLHNSSYYNHKVECICWDFPWLTHTSVWLRGGRKAHTVFENLKVFEYLHLPPFTLIHLNKIQCNKILW